MSLPCGREPLGSDDATIRSMDVGEGVAGVHGRGSCAFAAVRNSGPHP